MAVGNLNNKKGEPPLIGLVDLFVKGELLFLLSDWNIF